VKATQVRNRVPQRALERLELHEGKLSRAVLRGRGGGNAALLPGEGRSNAPFLPGGRFGRNDQSVLSFGFGSQE
jgi:hypothetical protein